MANFFTKFATSAAFAEIAAADKPLVNERKMVGDGVNYEAARAVLDATCLPDGEYPEGDISSVYFDTPNLDFLAEKENGDNLKSKVRLRWYDGGTGAIPAFLEIKLRIGAAREKFRKRLSVDAAWAASAPLAAADNGFVTLIADAARDWEFGAAIPRGITPVLCISYKRRRYVCPFTGSRVALDCGIRGARYNTAFFDSPDTVFAPEIVCEFKNDTGSIPPWVRTLQGNGFQLRSFSKYGKLTGHARHSF